MSTIAKLLANENITVVEGNFRTACFDLKSRTMCIPAWKDMTKSVRDLMTGHEVGHALFTPEAGWHKAIKQETADALKLPAFLLNIVEDVRIERMIQDRYPGLVTSFMKGYKELFDRDFFGTAGRDFNTFGFIDRINIKSKLRTLVTVPFSDDELALYNEVQDCETWADVVAVSRKIVEFINEQKQEENEESEIEDDCEDDEQSATDGTGQNVSSDGSDDSAQEDETQTENSETQTDEPTSTETSVEGESADETPESENQNSDVPPTGDLTSETDESYRSKENQLSETDRNDPTTIFGLTNSQIEECTLDMNDVFESWKSDLFNVSDDVRKTVIEDIETSNEELQKFLVTSKPMINVMIKEFQMRKNASRHARAKTAKSGSLSTEKLHSYKYNDDIFKRVTTLADDKNHGMVMFIDASGSMSNTIGDVIKQVIQLHLFCKAVGIPYEAYTFTTSYQYDYHKEKNTVNIPGVIEHHDFQLIKVMSSSMKRSEALEAMQLLWYSYVGQTYWKTTPRPLGLGGTPLVQTLLAAHSIVPAFVKKHRIEKVNTVILSDGEPTSYQAKDVYTYYRNHNYEYRIGSKRVYAKNQCVAATVALQTSLQEETGGDVINFFIANETRDAMSYVAKRCGFGCKQADTVRKLLRKNEPVVFDDIPGSTQTIILKSGTFTGEDDTFEVDDNISKQQMRKQFGKFMNSKKNNRIIFTKFAKKVAETC